MTTAHLGYSSSAQKDIVRREFDLPLITAFFKKKGSRLRYFGLPGAEALDIKTWGHMFDYVAAVEHSLPMMRTLEDYLDTKLSEIRYRTHLGDIDSVILRGRSQRPGNLGWHFVATTQHVEAGHYYWDFDVVYLDYTGKFLPYNQGGPRVRNRADAIRRLFVADRQDAWQPWILMITVESRFFGEQDRGLMRSFLTDARGDATGDLALLLDFLLADGLSPREQAARLIHGTASYLVAQGASNTGAHVKPRGTLVYQGAGTLPMLHFVYEIEPMGLLAHQDPMPLLCSPFLQVKNPAAQPWFELRLNQPPGQTVAHVRDALDFFDEATLTAICGPAH